MKKIRIGVVGCGGIANGKHLPAEKRNPASELVAFCDIIEERAIKAQKEFGAEGSAVYTDYKEMLKDKSIDAVLVLTPNCSHCEITVAALEAGKHVLCEKPMAMNYAEAKKMLAARDKSGKVLTIGYQNRFRPDSLYLKKLADKGYFGDVYYAEAIAIRWHMGGFDDAVRGGSFAVSDAYNTYPLAVKLHIADLTATYLLEQGTSNVENGHPKTK